MIDTIKKLYRQIVKPPRVATDNQKQEYIRKISAEWREILLIDVIILSFLVASAHQLAYFFEGGEPGVFSWIKAIGFDGAIALFSRHVSRAKVLNEKARGVWFVLIILMAITVACNMGYEWLKETGEISENAIVRDRVKNIKALIVSGSLAIIILGISSVRATIMKSFEERQRKYKRLSDDTTVRKRRSKKSSQDNSKVNVVENTQNQEKRILTGSSNYHRGRKM